MSTIKRYGKFMEQKHILAILTAIATWVTASVVYVLAMPQWITPMVTLTTLVVGSIFAFRKTEKQIASKLLGELEDFSKTFYSLTMAGSGENREMQIRFILDRVQISDRSQKDILQMRINRIRTCHDLIEKWFQCYIGKVEYFSKHPKLVDVGDTAQSINEFKEILAQYMKEVISASIDCINDVRIFPKGLKERLEEKFEALKIKYNHSMNQLNDYIKRFNKELGYQMDAVENISKKLNLETEKPNA